MSKGEQARMARLSTERTDREKTDMLRLAIYRASPQHCTSGDLANNRRTKTEQFSKTGYCSDILNPLPFQLYQQHKPRAHLTVLLALSWSREQSDAPVQRSIPHR